MHKPIAERPDHEVGGTGVFEAVKVGVVGAIAETVTGCDGNAFVIVQQGSLPPPLR
jgi:hypothetical protein